MRKTFKLIIEPGGDARPLPPIAIITCEIRKTPDGHKLIAIDAVDAISGHKIIDPDLLPSPDKLVEAAGLHDWAIRQDE